MSARFLLLYLVYVNIAISCCWSDSGSIHVGHIDHVEAEHFMNGNTLTDASLARITRTGVPIHISSLHNIIQVLDDQCTPMLTTSKVIETPYEFLSTTVGVFYFATTNSDDCKERSIIMISVVSEEGDIIQARRDKPNIVEVLRGVEVTFDLGYSLYDLTNSSSVDHVRGYSQSPYSFASRISTIYHLAVKKDTDTFDLALNYTIIVVVEQRSHNYVESKHYHMNVGEHFALEYDFMVVPVNAKCEPIEESDDIYVSLGNYVLSPNTSETYHFIQRGSNCDIMTKVIALQNFVRPRSLVPPKSGKYILQLGESVEIYNPPTQTSSDAFNIVTNSVCIEVPSIDPFEFQSVETGVFYVVPTHIECEANIIQHIALQTFVVVEKLTSILDLSLPYAGRLTHTMKLGETYIILFPHNDGIIEVEDYNCTTKSTAITAKDSMLEFTPNDVGNLYFTNLLGDHCDDKIKLKIIVLSEAESITSNGRISSLPIIIGAVFASLTIL